MKFPRTTLISPRITYSVAVLAIAALTGHVMQKDTGMVARLDSAAPDKAGAALPPAGLALTTGTPPSIAQPPAPPDVALAALPALPAASGTHEPSPAGVAVGSLAAPAPDLPPDTPAFLAALDPEPAASAGTAPAAPAALTDCTPALSLSNAPGAMVVLALAAPCAADDAVRISHAGIAFTARTGAQGELRVEVPALATPARFSVALPGVPAVTAQIEVPTLAHYDRAAASWTQPAALELHAFDSGAGYDDAGHVWRESAHDSHNAAAHGSMTSLGDAGIEGAALTEIYTYPAGKRATEGDIRLTLEAEVTAANCSHEIDASTLASTGGRADAPIMVTLYAPGCEATGDYLVLRDPVRAQRIAAR